LRVLAIGAFVSLEVVGAVFVIAAIAKLRSFSRFLEGLTHALRSRWVKPIALSVVGSELILGPLLVLQVRPNLTAAAAVILLGVFTVFLAVNMLRRNAVPCNCFGFDSGRPIDRRDLLRNLALLVLAAYGVAASSDQSSLLIARLLQNVATDAMSHPVPTIILGFLVCKEIMDSRRYARRAKEETNSRQGKPKSRSFLGYSVPDLVLERSQHGITTLYDVTAATDYMLIVFIGIGCDDCTMLLAAIADLTTDDRRFLTLVISGKGTVTDDVSGYPNVVHQEDGTLARFIGIPQTPSAILLDQRGRISSGISSGLNAVEAHVRSVVAVRRAS
jgi:hypothetical protein